MKKKIIPMLLSLAIALSFSLVGADLGLAADSMKDSVKPITNSSFQTANLDVKGFTAKDASIKRIKAGSTMLNCLLIFAVFNNMALSLNCA